MALPAAYTEGSLLAFMESVIGPHLEGLGLDANDQLQEAVNEVQGILGVPLSGLTSNADLMKVRAIARWQAWQAAADAASEKIPLKAGSASLEQSKIFDQIERRLAFAYGVAARYAEVLVLVGGSIPVPFAGGMSKAAKQSRRDDTDAVPPWFTRELHEPVGAGSETS